jgi:hypothetical protein
VQAQRGQLCDRGCSSEFEKFATTEILHRPRRLDALSGAKVEILSGSLSVRLTGPGSMVETRPRIHHSFFSDISIPKTTPASVNPAAKTVMT